MVVGEYACLVPDDWITSSPISNEKIKAKMNKPERQNGSWQLPTTTTVPFPRDRLRDSLAAWLGLGRGLFF